MKNKILNIVIIVIVILLLLRCDNKVIKNKIITSLGGYTEKEYAKSIDTFRRTVKIYADSTKRLVLNVNELNTRKIDSNYRVTRTPTLSTIGNRNNKQNIPMQVDSVISVAYTTLNTVSDTLIHGTIKTVINAQNCEIVEQSFEYQPKFPILVKEYITIKEKETEVISNKNKNKIGIGSNADSNGNIGVFGVYQTKSNWQVQGGVLQSINKDVLSNTSNPRYIQIGIVKLF